MNARSDVQATQRDAPAPSVSIPGHGPGRSRSSARAEAPAAMARILARRVGPGAVGALLTLMRLRGEGGEEIAGFVDA
jgi:anthranilate phosphoribosyltransferase